MNYNFNLYTNYFWNNSTSSKQLVNTCSFKNIQFDFTYSFKAQRSYLISNKNYPPHSPISKWLFSKPKTNMKRTFWNDVAAIQAAVTKVLKNICKHRFFYLLKMIYKWHKNLCKLWVIDPNVVLNLIEPILST